MYNDDPGVAAGDNMAARNKVPMACLRSPLRIILLLLLSLYYYFRFPLSPSCFTYLLRGRGSRGRALRPSHFILRVGIHVRITYPRVKRTRIYMYIYVYREAADTLTVPRRSTYHPCIRTSNSNAFVV